METIKVECKDCGATGLYSGLCEPVGVAVICVTCRGSGCQEIYFKPFIERKQKTEILTVRNFRGCITYQEFQQGKMP